MRSPVPVLSVALSASNVSQASCCTEDQGLFWFALKPQMLQQAGGKTSSFYSTVSSRSVDRKSEPPQRTGTHTHALLFLHAWQAMCT